MACPEVFVTVLHSIALIMSECLNDWHRPNEWAYSIVLLACVRLWVRIRLHRLWWEDGWAALALCLDVICAVSTWILTLPERMFSFNPFFHNVREYPCPQVIILGICREDRI